MRRKSPRAPRPAAEGFTLIELVVAISILGVVMAAACAAMLAAVKTNEEAGQRLDASNDLQYAATWFAEDIASANTVTPHAAAVCGAAATALLNLTSIDVDTTTAGVPATPPPSPEPTTRTVSYVLVTQSTSDGPRQVLERRACGTSGTPKIDRIAKRLSTAVAPVIDVAAAPRYSLTLTSGDDGSSFTLYGIRRSS